MKLPPEYENLPLSLLTRITKPEADIPLWIWAPLGPILISEPTSIDHLVASNYQVLPQDGNHPFISYLYSQLYLVEMTANENKTYPQLWARPADIESVKKCPVTLAASLELSIDIAANAYPELHTFVQSKLTEAIYSSLPPNAIYSGQPLATYTAPEMAIRFLPMLQYLPLPHMGEYALIDNEGDSLVAYNIAQLPKPAQELWKRLQLALFELADPTGWTPYHAATHSFCASEPLYQRRFADLRTISFTGNKEEREKAKTLIPRLTEAHQQVTHLRQSWLKHDWSIRWEEICKMTQELAAAYYVYHQAVVNSGNKPIPDIVNAFNMGVAEIFTHQPFQAYPAAAISRKGNKKDGGQWREETGEKENELIITYDRAKPSGTTSVRIRELAPDSQARDMAIANMWAQSKRLSDLDADVYLAMIAQQCAGQKDEQGFTWILTSHILDYRGIEPKKGKTEAGSTYDAGHRWEDIEEIGDCIERMKNVYIKIHEQEIIDDNAPASSKRKRITISRESPLFIFGDIIYHNQLPLDGSPGKAIPIAFQYRESSWMLPFLEGSNRVTGKLFQKCLNYDPHNEKWEKRLSRHFLFWLRTNASRENKPAPHIAELFVELNLDPDERFPQRTRDRFEKAMNRLVEDGLLTWRYKEDFELPSRKWLATWLAQQIIVGNSPILQSQYMTIQATAKTIRAANNAARQLPKRAKGKR